MGGQTALQRRLCWCWVDLLTHSGLLGCEWGSSLFFQIGRLTSTLLYQRARLSFVVIGVRLVLLVLRPWVSTTYQVWTYLMLLESQACLTTHIWKTFLSLIALMAALLRFDGSGVLRVRPTCLLLLLAWAGRLLRPTISSTIRTTAIPWLDYHLVHVLHTLSETLSLLESTMATGGC